MSAHEGAQDVYDTFLTLAQRCEQAKGPDKRLGAEIEIALRGFPQRAYSQRNGMRPKGSPNIDRLAFMAEWAGDVTASLSTALGLLDKRALWAIGDMEEGPFARLCWPQPNGGFDGGYVEVMAATVELSLLAAILRARAEITRLTSSNGAGQ
jgi:hypothetical protein